MTAIGIARLIMLILALIGRWRIFRKFGEAGWKSLIPFYGKWGEYGYTWNPKNVSWDVIETIIDYIRDSDVIVRWQGPLLTVVTIAVIVIAAYKLSRAFGHGAGYAIGLVLAPWLFQFILGCGSSLYNGPEGRWPKARE